MSGSRLALADVCGSTAPSLEVDMRGSPSGAAEGPGADIPTTFQEHSAPRLTLPALGAICYRQRRSRANLANALLLARTMEKGRCKMKLSVTLLLAAALSGTTVMGATTGIAVAADNQITILYDVFGNDRTMKKDWGYSALVEVAGKRILFDTGNDRDIFAANVKAK